MKSVVAVNCKIPTAEHYLQYLSGASLRDYDIAVFDPKFPDLERVHFSGGGSCFSVEATNSLLGAMKHWREEITHAVQAGKTVFVLLNDRTEDLAASGSTYSKSQRTYSTFSIHNYQSIPKNLVIANSKGKRINPTDNLYRGLHEVIKEYMEYRVIVKEGFSRQIFKTIDGATIGAITKLSDMPGRILFLPYFEFNELYFSEINSDGMRVWSEEAVRLSKGLIGQLVAVGKSLGGDGEQIPPPEWLKEIRMPAEILSFNNDISDIDEKISELRLRRDELNHCKEKLLEYSFLLYGTGKPLENAIEKALILLGFTSESLKIDDLEIDHVITSPSGLRMIGESEGKDTSAIDIAKFRQLESNIGEDLEREEIDEPAKGVLFGNGFRLTKPTDRSEQFTQKSLTNSRRLGTALVRTADLYSVVVHLLDNPNDEQYRYACRLAIESTSGSIVEFPSP